MKPERIHAIWRSSQIAIRSGLFALQGDRASVPRGKTAGASMAIGYEDFAKVDIRVGTILEVEPFPEARKPAYKLRIDFGPEIGVKRSSAQVTDLYAAGDLVGRQVCAVVNFPPKRIGPFLSEVLVLGLPGEGGAVVLIRPDSPVADGGRLY